MFSGMKNWLEIRIGLDDVTRTHLTECRVPGNANLLSTLGFVALIGYAIEVLSGIFLLIYYVPHPDYAFQSVQDIMNKVPYGWFFREIHVVGSNIMIMAVILHMLTVFFMGNYKKPRELTWLGGGLMLIVTLIFCLSGYLLPWSQLSYWATTVVTSMPTAFPVIGDFMAGLFRGGEQVTDITLGRFFALHVAILPPIFMSLMVVHYFLIRRTGLSSGKPDEGKGAEYRKENHPDGYPYYPYFFEKQMFMVFLYIAVIFFVMSFLPNLFLPIAANTPADPFKTPAEIRPEWYFLAPYQMLKLIPNKFLGIIMQIMIVGFFLLWPFFDTEKEGPVWRTSVLRIIFIFLLLLWVVLMYLGRF